MVDQRDRVPRQALISNTMQRRRTAVYTKGGICDRLQHTTNPKTQSVSYAAVEEGGKLGRPQRRCPSHEMQSEYHGVSAMYLRLGHLCSYVDDGQNTNIMLQMSWSRLRLRDKSSRPHGSSADGIFVNNFARVGTF